MVASVHYDRNRFRFSLHLGLLQRIVPLVRIEIPVVFTSQRTVQRAHRKDVGCRRRSAEGTLWRPCAGHPRLCQRDRTHQARRHRCLWDQYVEHESVAREKWQTSPKNRGWLVLHALCDVDTGEILAYAITDETVGDAPMLRVLVEAATEKGHVFDKLYADGAYSSDENWILLCRERKIGFVTSFKSNTRPTNNGSVARGEAARLWCSLTYDEWVKASGYGVRWKCECVFSDLKRLFPETITAMSNNGILRQLCSRIEVFNRYKITRAGIMGVTGNGVTVA